MEVTRYCYAMLVAMSKRIGVFVFALLACSQLGCTAAEDRDDRTDQAWITAVIVGSAETPDPVLVWVQELERDGKVKDVTVMESFPVQIRLTAPRHIIEELNAAKRKLPPDPL